MSQFEIRSRFVITSAETLPGEMASRLEIAPSRAWSIGDLVSKMSTHYHRLNGWCLRYDGAETTDVHEQIGALLDLVEESRVGLAQLGEICDFTMSVAIHGLECLPEVTLSNALLQRLSRLRADLDFDLYNLGLRDGEGLSPTGPTAGRIIPVVPFDVRARLEITSQVTSAEDITNHLCVDPSSTWVKGDTSEIDGTRFENHGWCLNSRFLPHVRGQYHLSDIVDAFDGLDWVLADLEDTCEFKIRLGVIRVEYFPPLTLDSCLLRRLADLKMGVEIELDDLGGGD